MLKRGALPNDQGENHFSMSSPKNEAWALAQMCKRMTFVGYRPTGRSAMIWTARPSSCSAPWLNPDSIRNREAAAKRGLAARLPCRSFWLS
jgi:hypothetical protein